MGKSAQMSKVIANQHTIIDEAGTILTLLAKNDLVKEIHVGAIISKDCHKRKGIRKIKYRLRTEGFVELIIQIGTLIQSFSMHPVTTKLEMMYSQITRTIVSYCRENDFILGYQTLEDEITEDELLLRAEYWEKVFNDLIDQLSSTPNYSGYRELKLLHKVIRLLKDRESQSLDKFQELIDLLIAKKLNLDNLQENIGKTNRKNSELKENCKGLQEQVTLLSSERDQLIDQIKVGNQSILNKVIKLFSFLLMKLKNSIFQGKRCKYER